MCIRDRRGQPRLHLFARHEPGPEESAALRDLEARGARVTTTSLDVADADAVKAFFEKIRTTEGRIDGVIHAAGVGGGSLIARTGEAEIAPVLRAKIDGTRALAEALADSPVDFVALCSSLTAVLGGPGQIAYAAANAWMDAFAQTRAAAGQPWFSIRWDTWAEVGMATRPFAAEVTGQTLREWTVSPSAASFRSVMMTRAPCLANACAHDRPLPDAAPVLTQRHISAAFKLNAAW